MIFTKSPRNIHKNDIAILLIGEELYGKLILEALSSELEYMLFLHSKKLANQAKVLLRLFKRFVRTQLPNLKNEIVGLVIDVRDMLYYNEKRTSKAYVEENLASLREFLLESFVKIVDCEVKLRSSTMDPIKLVYLLTIYVQNLTAFDDAKTEAVQLFKKFGHLIADKKHLIDYLADLFKNGKTDTENMEDMIKLLPTLQEPQTLWKKISSRIGKSKFEPAPLPGSQLVYTEKVAIRNATSPNYIKKASYMLSHPQHFLYCYTFDEDFFDKILSEPKKRGTSYYVDCMTNLGKSFNKCMK